MSIHIILIIVFMFLLHQASRDSYWIGSWLRLPGTFAHELTHLFFGALTNAKPMTMNLLPKRMGRHVILGQVAFRNLTWYNAAITGLAPLVLVVVALNVDRWSRTQKISYNLFCAFIEANLLMACIPSGTDFKVATRYSLIPAILAILLFLLYSR